MKKIIKITFFAGLAAGLHLFAANVNNGTPYPVKKPQIQEKKAFEQGYQTDSNSMVQGYSYPGRISVSDKWDFYSYVSLLYWQMIADGYDFIFDYNSTTHEYNPVRWPHKWKPALKTGLAMTFHNHDDWRMLGEYLRYYSTTKVSASKKSGDDNYLVINAWAGGNTVQSADGRLHVGIDAVNFSLDRPYYMGSKLIVNPLCGIHAAWIHQDVHTNIYDVTDHVEGRVPTYNKSKDWALGPRAGFDAKFLLGEGVRFFGKGALSLNYCRQYYFGQFYGFANDIINPQQVVNDSRSFLRPELELGGGFGWGTYIDDYNWNFDLSLGYDMYLIFKEQNIQYERLDYYYSSMKPMNLCLHGLTFSARLDF